MWSYCENWLTFCFSQIPPKRTLCKFAASAYLVQLLCLQRTRLLFHWPGAKSEPFHYIRVKCDYITVYVSAGAISRRFYLQPMSEWLTPNNFGLWRKPQSKEALGVHLSPLLLAFAIHLLCFSHCTTLYTTVLDSWRAKNWLRLQTSAGTSFFTKLVLFLPFFM